MAELRFGGGINQLDEDLVNPDECIDGENFCLEAESRRFKRRPSFDLKGTATNGAEVRGIMQLIKRDDTVTTLVQAAETVYDWDGSTTFTSKATIATDSLLRASYWSLDDLLVITDINKSTTCRTWNGSTLGTLTHAITGVTNLYAKYSVVWQHRVWLFNVTTDANANPHVILASEYENYDNYDNSVTPVATSLTYSDPFFLTTPDLKPINGVAVFFDTIIVSTVEGKLFKITGTDATDYAIKEYYAGSSVAADELMVNVGNDVMFVRRGGKIESLRATETYGDTQIDDASRWLNTETAGIASGLSVYDQTTQRVCFFTSNKVLVLDKYVWESQTGLSPWMKWTTQMLTNLDVKAATYLRIPGSTNYTVYFGGPSGQIYNMNGTGSGDAGGTNIKTFRESFLVTTLNTVDDLVCGRIHYRRKGTMNLDMTFMWTDEYVDTMCRVPLKGAITSVGTNFWGGSVYWGQAVYWGAGGLSEERVSTAGFSAPGKGPSFFLKLAADTTVDWTVIKIETEA